MTAALSGEATSPGPSRKPSATTSALTPIAVSTAMASSVPGGTPFAPKNLADAQLVGAALVGGAALPDGAAGTVIRLAVTFPPLTVPVIRTWLPATNCWGVAGRGFRPATRSCGLAVGRRSKGDASEPCDLGLAVTVVPNRLEAGRYRR